MLQFFSSLPARVRSWLGLTNEIPTAAEARCWFIFALIYAAVCAALALRQAFAADYVLADDVREHIFWMFRFLDPKLFPQDPIADYFQAIAPLGFAALYHLLARFGIDPLLASKLIPPVLGLLSTGYLFALVLRVTRSPAASAVSAILLCQCLWLSTDLCSATPRAFFYPLFVAFVYHQARGERLGVFLTIVLQALFFPPAALLSLGVLVLDLIHWKKDRPVLSRAVHAYLFLIGVIGTVLLLLLVYLHVSEKFGPMVSYADARRMPEFGPGGRVPFFSPSLWFYWIEGSAGLHVQSRPQWLFAALLWPVLLYFPTRFPLLQRVTRLRPLAQVWGSALILFVLSHALLFRLYLPSRYTQHTARVLLAFAAGVVILALGDALLRVAERRGEECRCVSCIGALGLALVLFCSVVCFPLFLKDFPHAGYVIGKRPDLYRFFGAQPRTIRIASLADEANNLPTFCRRSIIMGVKTAVPFHPGYYMPLRQRGLEIARAQYSPDLAAVQQCLRHQLIDFWLIDRGAFTTEYVRNNRLLRQLGEPIPDLATRVTPWMQEPPPQCVAFADARFVVLDARAVLALSVATISAGGRVYE
jgi:hypothetical protein